MTAVDELSKQGVPDVSGGLPTPNPTFKALSDLAGQLNGAVLMGHSQSGPFPLEAALLDPAATKGLVLVEPGRCPATYTAEQIKTLATVPIWSSSVITATRRPAFRRCPHGSSLRGLSDAHRPRQQRGGPGGDARPADRGIRGNSHMIMQDKNNLQIADDPAVDR